MVGVIVYIKHKCCEWEALLVLLLREENLKQNTTKTTS